MRQLQKMYHTHNGNARRKREKGTEEIFKAIMTENVPKHDRHQMTDPGNLKKMVGMQTGAVTLENRTEFPQ